MENKHSHRLAIVSETYPPEINGVALTVQNMVQELCALGKRVLLVRPKQAHDSDATRPRHYAELLLPGAGLPFYSGLRFGWPAKARLEQAFRDLEIDSVYVATEGPLGYSAIAAARSLGLPVCAGFHTRFDDYLAHYGLSLLRPLALGWLRHFHNRAHCTLVPTAELRDWLHGNGVQRVRLLRRAVDTRLFSPLHRSETLRASLGLAPNDLMLIHVGRIAAEKNLPLLQRCYRAIRNEFPTARMVWVGDGPQRVALAREYPEQIFVGSRRGEELARYFASADLFLFPSLSETFGNVTLEAMASGIDLCAFNYGAAREHARHAETAWLSEFGNETQFLERALLAARAVNQGQRLGTRACVSVAHLQPQSVAQSLLQIYSDLHANPGSRADAYLHSSIL